MDIWFLTAGGLSAALAVLHVFGGGPEAARPLLAANDLPPVPKYLMYYCWHLVTLMIGAMAVGFLAAGLWPAQQGLAVLCTAMALGGAVWGLALVPGVGRRYAEMPQGFLFLPIAMIGGLGLVL